MEKKLQQSLKEARDYMAGRLKKYKERIDALQFMAPESMANLDDFSLRLVTRLKHYQIMVEYLNGVLENDGKS